MAIDTYFEDFTDITQRILEAFDHIEPDHEWAWSVTLIHNDPDGPCTACDGTHEPGIDRAERRRRERAHRKAHRDAKVQVDFGYTIGLHDHGLPEFHLPAHPTVDVEGFALPSDIVGVVLNRAACVAVEDGSLAGKRFDLSANDGEIRMRFAVASPTEPSEVSANQVDDAATVTPILWDVEFRHPECVNH